MSLIRKILFCCGSRPELIKLAPVYHRLKESLPTAHVLFCDTGQHKDLMPPHFSSLKITPDFQLNVMQDQQTLDQLVALLFQTLSPLLKKINPHLVVIQGDTASSFVSAMIARRENIPLAHIEAGLRTYDHSAPFPEEIYRQNISQLASWHFCPTTLARDNLLREGIADSRIFVTGNTAVDMVLSMARKSPPAALTTGSRKPFFLITLHRRESQGSPLERIITSLLDFAQSRPAFDFILPLHPNPNSANMIRERLENQPNIRLLAPLPYPDFVRLMQDSFAIITDSGGIQEEAPALNIPVVVVRDRTERPEGITAGCFKLAGTEKESIIKALNLLIDDPAHYRKIQQAPNPFGDGRAAEKITAHLITLITGEASHNRPSF